MNLLPPPKAPVAARPSIMGAVKNLGRGLYNATAKFANYAAATPTATTRVSSYTGTNLNSTISQIQRVGMNWTAEDVFKNSCIAAAYILQRINYCSSMMVYIPATGDAGLDKAIKTYLQGEDGCGGVFGKMGVDCSMQDAFSRTADIETPIRGDAGLIFWEDETGDMRLIEWSADQLGEIYNFTLPRTCGLTRNSYGVIEETSGSDCVYLSGRYFRGADCVAYKIYERTNSWYANPRIYSASDVIYFRDPASFRGVRGFTKFATAIQHMEKGETLFQTGMDAAMRQSKTAMIVTNCAGQPDEPSYTPFQGADGQVTYAERIPGGPQVEYFYSGDTAQFVSPDSPGPELIEGIDTSDERVALALGVTYSFLVSPEKVGGAPSRLDINKVAKEWKRIQNTIHRPRLGRIRDVVILNAVRKGILPAHPNITNGRWVLPISPSVDAFYDAKENIAMVRSGLEAPQDVIAETNRDADDVLEKKVQWAMKVALKVKAINDLPEMKDCEPITKEDIAQISDNPQQQANAQATDANGKVVGNSRIQNTAKLSGWDESKHPRVESGENGGEFTSKVMHMASRGNYDTLPKTPFYLASTEEYASNYGSNLHEVHVSPRNTFDLTDITADAEDGAIKLRDKLSKSGVDISGIKFSKDDELAQSLNRNLPELSKRIKNAGYDSVSLNEYVLGGGKDETMLVLSDRIITKHQKK